jgi:hypothetical protein
MHEMWNEQNILFYMTSFFVLPTFISDNGLYPKRTKHKKVMQTVCQLIVSQKVKCIIIPLTNLKLF